MENLGKHDKILINKSVREVIRPVFHFKYWNEKL